MSLHVPEASLQSSLLGNESHARAHAVNEKYLMDFENILQEGREPVMTKEYRPQVAYNLAKPLNPEMLKRFVLRSEKMRKIISHYACQKKCSTKQIERQAKEIIDEIGLDRSLAIIRWCGMAITAIGKRICSGIYVNAANIDTLKKELGKCPVLYLPSHRSYMDFILMSYICFHYDIEIPGIAAGMDFHSMFGMGTMLRNTGAFFMRRSFTNDDMYWDIFREYMHALVSSYHIGVEFFIEGTRSRNFKALVPKIGLLSMALLPYFTGEVSDITVVPVSISYERVLEEELFVYELLGVPKPKESTKGFLKALKIINEHFGRMYVDFGVPISVREFFGHTCENNLQRAQIGAHLQKLSNNEIGSIKNLATEVIYQQQRRIVITTFNLITLYFASYLYCERSLHIDELTQGLLRLKIMFEQLGAHVATNKDCIEVEILETVNIHSNIVHLQSSHLKLTESTSEKLVQVMDPTRLKAHTLSSETMAVAVPSLLLQLYINPCVFWLARPAFLILAALEIQEETNTSTMVVDKDLKADLKSRVSFMEEIFSHEFITDSSREEEEFENNIIFLQQNNVLNLFLKPTQMIVNENECSFSILSALAPFVCLYYQLSVTLNQFSRTVEFNTKDVLVHMQKRIEQLLHKNEQNQQFVHPYCLALDNLNIALFSFVQQGYLQKNKPTGTLKHSQNHEAKSLELLEHKMLRYCRLMPFKRYFEIFGGRQEDIHRFSSKL